uniref:Uncharacterized protein n=1 Tax=Oryza meridionalis TaxID=40149 RepID=A0A0E0CLP7_9ORYZ
MDLVAMIEVLPVPKPQRSVLEHDEPSTYGEQEEPKESAGRQQDGMGSSVGATIFYCVALSMVIVMTQLPPTEADSVAAAEFASSDLKADKLTSRKLMGAASLAIYMAI